MESYSSIKKNENMKFAGKWMTKKNIQGEDLELEREMPHVLSYWRLIASNVQM